MIELPRFKRPENIFPVTEDQWESGFKSGEWDFLDQDPDEISRHAVIASYVSFISRSMGEKSGTLGTIMDVGCGEGTLYRSIPSEIKPLYRGLDFSGQAIEKAKIKNPSTPHFYKKDMWEFLADLEEYAASDIHPDMIIFNESLYYLENRVGAFLDRLQKAMHEDSVLIVSMSNNASSVVTYNLDEWASLFNLFNKIKLVSFNNEETVWQIALLGKK